MANGIAVFGSQLTITVNEAVFPVSPGLPLLTYNTPQQILQTDAEGFRGDFFGASYFGVADQSELAAFTPSGFSGTFNGSSDSIQIASNAIYALGTGNWTIEFYIFPLTTPAAAGQGIFDTRPASTNGVYPTIYYASDRSVRFFVSSADRITSSPLTLSTWNHIAVVKNGSTTTMYLNGTATGSTFADTNNYIQSGVIIGASFGGGASITNFFNGNISNLRVVRGLAVYTGAFTRPATPLSNTQTAATNVSAITTTTSTVLLTLNTGSQGIGVVSANHIDRSAYTATIVRNGNPTVTPTYGSNFGFVPAPSELSFALSGSSIPGFAVQFNGVNGYLGVANNANLTLGTADFTIEGWIYITNYSLASGVASKGGSGTDSYFFGVNDTNGRLVFTIENTTYFASTGQIIPLNTWVHVAAVRTSSTITLYYNGNSVSSVTYTGSLSSNGETRIGRGRDTSSNYFQGFISNVRITKGFAQYTTSFTPFAPLTVNTSSVVLLTGQNSNIVDNSVNNYTITRYGSPLPSTTGIFYTNGAISFTQQTVTPAPVVSFNGTSQFISTPVNATAFQLATVTTPFTLELWVYPTAFTSVTLISSTYPGSGSIPFVIGMSNGSDSNGSSAGPFPWFNYWNGSSWAVGAISNTPLVVNTWQHVAVVYTGANAFIYINGQRTATWSNATWINTAGTAQLLIGRRWDTAGNNFFSGFMSNVRFTNGQALYLTNFTPQAPLTSTPGVTTLLAITTATIGDASSNGFALTANGTPTPTVNTSTFVYSNNRITFPQGLPWTIECWINPTGNYTTRNTIFAKRGSAGISYTGYLSNSDGNLSFFNGQTFFQTRFSPPVGRWTHCAWVFDINNNLNIYANSLNLFTTSTNIVDVTAPFTVGVITSSTNQLQEYFFGSISNLRVVKGSSVYYGQFTPPQFPLLTTQVASTNTLAITTADVSLLTLQSSTLIDNSGYTLTNYTAVGPVLVNRGPGILNTTTLFTDGLRNGFYKPTVYIEPDWSTNFNSTNADLQIRVNTTASATGRYLKNAPPVSADTPIPLVNVPIAGYSGRFNFANTNSFLVVNSSTSLNLTNTDYTIEAWVNPIGDYSQFNCIVAKRINNSTSTSYSMYIQQNTGFLMFYNGFAQFATTTPIVPNRWSHVAVTYATLTDIVSFYVNGLESGTARVQRTIDYNTPVTIGWSNFGLENFRGSISNLRISRKNIYTGSFVPQVPGPAGVPAVFQNSGTNIEALNTGDIVLCTLQEPVTVDDSIYNNAISQGGVNFVQLVPEGPGFTTTTLTNVNNTVSNYYIPVPYYSVGLNNNANFTSTDYITITGGETLIQNINNWSSSTFYSVEYWINPNTFFQTVDASTSTAVLGQMNFANTVSSWTFGPVANGTVKFTYNTGTTASITTTATIGLGRWSHLAFVKNVNTLTIFINGIPSATAPLVGTPVSGLGLFTVGARNNTYFNGRISDLRVVVNNLLYTGTFTVALTPLTAVTGTQLLAFSSSTWTDLSTNTFTINRVGTPQIYSAGPYLLWTGTVSNSTLNIRQPYIPAQSSTIITDPFGARATGFTGTQYTPPSYSISFTGSEFLRTRDDNIGALDLPENFTIEGWFRRDSGSAAAFVLNRAGGPNIAWASYEIVAGTSGAVWFAASSANNNYDIGSEGSTGTIGFYNLGQWTHFHVTRNGPVYSGYINGIGAYQQVTTATPYSPRNFLGVDRGLNIGGSYTTLWGGSTATNTFPGLISNIRINRSASEYSVTTGTQYTTFSTFFNGSSDFFQVNTGSNTALGFGGGGTAWCVECWVRPTGDYSQSRTIWGSRVSGTGAAMAQGYLRITTGLVSFYNGTTEFVSSYVLPPNVWSHVVWSYSGTVLRMFVDGVLIFNGAATITNQGQPFTVGGLRGYNEFFQGYLSNLRVVRGDLTYTTSTGLILDGGATQGYGGLFKDVSADFISIASTTTFGLGTSSFTIECFIFPTQNPGNGIGTVFDFRTGPTTTAMVGRINSNRQVMFYDGPQNSEPAFTTATVNLRAWNHIAWVRNVNTMTVYVNGVSAGSHGLSPTLSNYGTNQPLRIGANQTAGFNFNGIISNFRITRGVARYTTSTYQIPAGPLGADAQTIFLTLQESFFTATFFNTFTGVNIPISLSGNPSVTANVGYTTTGSLVTLRYFNSPELPLSNTQVSATNTNAISGTQTSLLVMQNPGPRIVDNSTYQFTTTILGGTVSAALYPWPNTWTNYIPPSVALTATTSTVLLAANSPLTAFTTSTAVWAARFNGADYMVLPQLAGAIATGPFTIEMWVFPQSNSRNLINNSYWNVGQNGGWRIGIGATGALSISISGGVFNTFPGILDSTVGLTLNTWTHIALVRDLTNTLAWYINGIQRGSTTFTGSLNANSGGSQANYGLYVGALIADGSIQPTTFNGYISNLRIVNGVAVYTGAFTPPTEILRTVQPSGTNISAVTTQTQLLTLQEQAIVDETRFSWGITRVGVPVMQTAISPALTGSTATQYYRDLSTGSIYISNTNTALIPTVTHVNPFGTVSTTSIFESVYFNQNDFYTINAQTATSFATADFTVETWVNPLSGNGYAGLLEARSNTAAVPWILGLRLDGSVYKLEFYRGATATGVTPIPYGQWTHVAVTRRGTLLTYWVNGRVDTTATVSAATAFNAQGATQRLGYLWDGGNNGLHGFMSNMRVVRGLAVYTSTFTPARLLSVTQDAAPGIQAIPPITAANTFTGTTLLLFQDQYNRDNGPQNVRVTTAQGTPITSFYSPNSWTTETFTSTVFQTIYRQTVPVLSTNTGFTYISTSTSLFQRLYVPVTFYPVIRNIFEQAGGSWTTNFSGASYLLIANTSTLNLSSSSWTMEAWVNPAFGQTFTSNQGLFGRRIPNVMTGTSYMAFLNQGDGRLSFRNFTSTFVSNYRPEAGQWTHIAYTFDSTGTSFTGTIRMYANGREVYSTGTTIVDTTGTFVIGYGNTGTEFFVGQMSNLRVTRGKRVYTGDFTVPNWPLSTVQAASTNTQNLAGGDVVLLTLQNPTFINNSSYPLTLFTAIAPIITWGGPGFVSTTSVRVKTMSDGDIRVPVSTMTRVFDPNIQRHSTVLYNPYPVPIGMTVRARPDTGLWRYEPYTKVQIFQIVPFVPSGQETGPGGLSDYWA